MGCHNWGEATDTCPWIEAKDATQHPTGHGAAEGYMVQTSRLRNPAQIQTPVQACTSSAGGRGGGNPPGSASLSLSIPKVVCPVTLSMIEAEFVSSSA